MGTIAMRGGMKNSILVTGADRGLGLAFVEHYLQQGNNVIATSRRQPIGDALQNLQQLHQDKLTVYFVDLTDEVSINHFAEQLATLNIALDIVINNAGISVEQSLGNWKTENFIQHFMVNSIAPMLMAQAVLPYMKADSKLIQITSGVGSAQWNIGTEKGLDAYAASKGALNILSRRLSAKVADKNIIVSLLNPGWVQTDMGGSAATTTIEQATLQMTQTIAELSLKQSGLFIEADGSLIPW